MWTLCILGDTGTCHASPCSRYLVHDELVRAVRERPAVLLHQGDEGETKQLLLTLLLGCGETQRWQ